MTKISYNDLTRNLKTVHTVWLFFQERNRKVTIYGRDIRINGKANNRHPRRKYKVC